VQKWVPPLCKFHSAKKKYCGALYGIFMSKNFLTFGTKCNLKPDALSKTLNILHPNFLFCRRDLVVCNVIPGGDWENFAEKQGSRKTVPFFVFGKLHTLCAHS
jgi:hypothetical protein